MKIETKSWILPPNASAPKKQDYEFIRSTTKEEALSAIEYFFTEVGGRGLNYAITVKVEDEYLTYWMKNMPCYGGLCKYKVIHGEKYSMNSYFPSDFPLVFPDGEIVYISLPYGENHRQNNPVYWDWALSQESPWVSGIGKEGSFIVKKNFFILTDMNTDPTVLYHLLKFSGITGGMFRLPWYWTYDDPRAYYVAYGHTLDKRRFAAKAPIKISGGTWAEGYGYTRPFNEYVFGTSIPMSVQDMMSLPDGYNSKVGVIETDYFNEVMKSLGVEILEKSNIFMKKAGQKQVPETLLLEAWDIFKKQGEELYGNA
jgi:hypothetical protein